MHAPHEGGNPDASPHTQRKWALVWVPADFLMRVCAKHSFAQTCIWRRDDAECEEGSSLYLRRAGGAHFPRRYDLARRLILRILELNAHG